MNEFEEYMKKMIKEGYWSKEDLSPIKCDKCNSVNLKDKNYYYDEFTLVSYERRCENCDSIVGSWSYGAWEI